MTSDSTAVPLLTVAGLSLTRGGRKLFNDLSFAVLPGQLWQIEGPNGAGKTSLMRVLSGLARYGFTGDVVRPPQSLYLGHASAVKGMLTPTENLSWHLSGESQWSAAAIVEALAQVGLSGYEHLPAASLSAGQQRRINLARLYLSNAGLWLLDEPFTAIDRDGVAALQARMAAHVAAGGAVMVTSHQALEVGCDLHRLDLRAGVVA